MVAHLYVFAMLGCLVAMAVAQKADYCHVASCENKPHTLCKYPFKKVSRNCGKVDSSDVTGAEIKELLKIHNQLRKRVASGQEQRGNPGPQPAATNMKHLVWDEELAGIAQTWADQCLVKHDPCRNVEKYQVGQNIAWQANTLPNTFTLTELVEGWYSEVDKFDGTTVGSYIDNDAYGHYAQLVWAETKRLGCGVVRYNNDGKWNSILLVCNYGPSANLPGAPVYKTA